MERTLDILSHLGAMLLHSILLFGLFLGPILAAYKLVPDPKPKTRFLSVSKRQRWQVGALRFSVWVGMTILCFALFYPSVDAIKRESCKGAEDFKLCMDGE